MKLLRVGYFMGTRRTFVPKGSVYLPSHHKNWRLRAMDRAGNIGDEELMFTAPFSVSKKGLEVFRSELQDFIKSLSARLDGFGDAEEVVCLNIDLFKIVKVD
ncbi:hypothetical protein AZI86_11445 [Bdellovibrio bacteriovorus]|uniref:Uncharacterized protein n=1 Tax=Bdellovibrio bacteriovorus TaxID=959 RepID=A0A150WLP8_BDEBC|nr:hypothetical protein [Bdellovibrio bacteriovorus]KYG64812.1 hypothetical protein AZI86_11445 [Bdellovibrio bacteriovorus]